MCRCFNLFNIDVLVVCLIFLWLQFELVMGKCVFNCKWSSDGKFSWVKEYKGDNHNAVSMSQTLFCCTLDVSANFIIASDCTVIL